jgi:hypothetical protein
VGRDILTKREASESPAPIVVYVVPDGRTRVQCRFDEGSIWLAQGQMAALYQVTVPTVNEHLRNIFEEGEQRPEATIRRFPIVRTEGNRTVSREVEHYSLPAILAVGYRVRSRIGVAFRQWATARFSSRASSWTTSA